MRWWNFCACLRCVICRVDYEDGETLTLLSCQHAYHSECINDWLRINKVHYAHLNFPSCTLMLSNASLFSLSSYLRNLLFFELSSFWPTVVLTSSNPMISLWFLLVFVIAIFSCLNPLGLSSWLPLNLCSSRRTKGC